MRFIVALILTAAAAYGLGLFLDWWAIAIAAFLIGLLIPQKAGTAFICGFLSIALLWFSLAFIIDLYNDHIMANRISQLLLQRYAPKTIVVITALLGGIVGGFSMMTAAFVRNKRFPKKVRSVYS
ncbi:hypothetical protein COR50_15335 [Chitinophaga caeni]|uniref:Uncharacterized protein n=1 Tax=Chitinophaga caeni TaxID=2029983 RepID=A0A291QX28_9BACT|nr:hypothetical protein [Chitinophaga caeni]ATL48423.1 hypothetical protein COR50_15335 [Chitinophaga caeni]